MASLSSVTRKAAPQPVFKVQEHIIAASYIRQYPRALVDNNDIDLRQAVKQYTPLDNLAPHDGDVTIIGAHANGFPKELYEPLWDEIYHKLKARGLNIRNIFCADVTWQGQSGVLNEAKLGNDPSWLDASRDLLLMINHFRADIKQPIIGVGHSMGGNMLVNLSHLHPVLFTSLILIDPVIMRRPNGTTAFLPAGASSRRRDRWPNQAAAEAAFKKSKFYQSWDPRVLDLFFKYGFRELPTHIYPDSQAGKEEKEVTLATTKHQEVMTFLRAGPASQGIPSPYPQPGISDRLAHPELDPDCEPQSPFYRPELHIAFQRLATLRPGVFFIFAGKSNLSDPVLSADKLATTGTGPRGNGGVKAGRVKHITLVDAGHLVPFEDVNGVADHCSTWMTTELGRWSEENAALKQDWERIPAEQKSVLSESYIKSLDAANVKFFGPRKEKEPSKL